MNLPFGFGIDQPRLFFVAKIYLDRDHAMSPFEGSSHVGTADDLSTRAASKRVLAKFARFDWDRFALWAKRISLLVLALLVVNFVLRSLLQDLRDRDTLFIKFSNVASPLQAEGFGADDATQTLWNGIQQIQQEANTTADHTHPALLQADNSDTDLEKMAIPATDMSLGDLQELVRYLLPWLRPILVSGSIEESGKVLTPDFWLNNNALGLKPKPTNNDLAMAKLMLFSAGQKDNAAFAIVQSVDPVTALSALNGWQKITEAYEGVKDLSSNPQTPAIWRRAMNLRGFIEIEMNHYPDAVKTLTDPDLHNFAPALANLCYIYQDTGSDYFNPEAATKKCLQAVRFDPGLESPHLHLGVFFKFEADDPKVSPAASATFFNHALAEYQTAASLDPDGISAHTGIGDVLGDPGNAGHDYACSIFHYQAALFYKPKYSIAMLGLANSYSAKGDWSDADHWYYKAITQDPGLKPIEQFIQFDPQALSNTPPGAPQPSKLKAARNDLEHELQTKFTKNPTLANKIYTEIEIISQPTAPVTGDDSYCSSITPASARGR